MSVFLSSGNGFEIIDTERIAVESKGSTLTEYGFILEDNTDTRNLQISHVQWCWLSFDICFGEFHTLHI